MWRRVSDPPGRVIDPSPHEHCSAHRRSLALAWEVVPFHKTIYEASWLVDILTSFLCLVIPSRPEARTREESAVLRSAIGNLKSPIVTTLPPPVSWSQRFANNSRQTSEESRFPGKSLNRVRFPSSSKSLRSGELLEQSLKTWRLEAIWLFGILSFFSALSFRRSRRRGRARNLLFCFCKPRSFASPDRSTTQEVNRSY